MNIGKKLSIDVTRQRIPDWIFKEFTMREFPYYFLHKFEDGYDFWFDGFYVNHSEYVPNGAPATLLELQVEFIRDIRSRTLQNDKYNCNLVGTPERAGVFPAELAIARFTYVRYNEPYVNAETFKAKFSWKNIPTEAATVQVLMFGYKIPENSLDMWG